MVDHIGAKGGDLSIVLTDGVYGACELSNRYKGKQVIYCITSEEMTRTHTLYANNNSIFVDVNKLVG